MLTAKLTKLEELLVALLPLPLLWSASIVRSWLLVNAAVQAAIFLPLVIVPAFATGHMAYVDIGWPLGLAAMGAQFILNASGFWLRRWAVGGIMLLHGGRMAAGALVLFFPYRWPEDLPRYRYARLRYEREGGKRWPLKMLQDLVGQCWANAFILAAPLALSAADASPRVSAVEIVGWVGWLLSWSLESLADAQKLHFGRRNAPSSKDVLGHPPYDGKEYWLWARSRHPNYFFEWCCWVSLTIAALPSFGRLDAPIAAKLGYALALYLTPRTFYYCLVHWTGAEPAEHFSVLRRERYREYQRSTRVLWPFEAPLVDHGRRENWPRAKEG